METLNGEVESLKQQRSEHSDNINGKSSTLEELKKTCQSLIETENQLANEQAKEKEIHQPIEIMEKGIEELTIQIQTQKQGFESEHNEDLPVIEKLMRILNEFIKNIDDLQRQQDEMQESLKSQKEPHDFILDNFSEFLPFFFSDSSKTF